LDLRNFWKEEGSSFARLFEDPFLGWTDSIDNLFSRTTYTITTESRRICKEALHMIGTVYFHSREGRKNLLTEKFLLKEDSPFDFLPCKQIKVNNWIVLLLTWDSLTDSEVFRRVSVLICRWSSSF
jgi:hypothetical protein